MNIYVGNLPLSMDEDGLREAFGAFGEVSSASIVRDGATGASRGFGFVIMSVDGEAEAAIEEMNGKEIDGQAIKVEKGRGRTGGPRRSDNRGRGRSGPRGAGRGGPRGSGGGGPRGGGGGGQRSGGSRGGRY